MIDCRFLHSSEIALYFPKKYSVLAFCLENLVLPFFEQLFSLFLFFNETSKNYCVHRQPEKLLISLLKFIFLGLLSP